MTEAPAGVAASGNIDVKSLLENAANGDVEAFGELYGIFLERIFRYAYYLLGDRMLAEDVTEEVFLKAWKAIKSCKGREQTFVAWLYRIAHNQAIDVIRKRKKHLSLEMEAVGNIGDSAPDTAQKIEIKAEYQELIKAIARLPELQRQVVVLKFIEGMENSEIGRIMGKSQGAVRILQMRALTTIRQQRR